MRYSFVVLDNSKVGKDHKKRAAQRPLFLLIYLLVHLGSQSNA